MLLVSQMAMGLNDDSLQTAYEKQVDNLKVTTKFLSEKRTARHNKVREFALELLIYNEMLHSDSEGTLDIIELQNLNDSINISTPSNSQTHQIRIYTHANENADSPKSYFACIYTHPNE